MKILIVGLSTHPQIKRLQEEAEKRGHEVVGCYTSELVISASQNDFNVSLRGDPINHDLIYFWAVGKRRWEWYVAAEFLNKSRGTVIVNRKAIEADYNYFLTPANDFLKQNEEKLLFPKSSIVFSPKSVDSVVSEYSFPVVVKSTTGHQGKSVFLVNDREELRNKVKEITVDAPAAVVREFIPNDGDVRIFTVGYKAIGAMKRSPTKEGEFRSNISVGGRGENFDLSARPDVAKIAEKLSKITRTEIAGVDIMIHKETGDPYILEINPGPQFMGLEKYTDTNAALEIIKYFEQLKSHNIMITS